MAIFDPGGLQIILALQKVSTGQNYVCTNAYINQGIFSDDGTRTCHNLSKYET